MKYDTKGLDPQIRVRKVGLRSGLVVDLECKRYTIGRPRSLWVDNLGIRQKSILKRDVKTRKKTIYHIGIRIISPFDLEKLRKTT